MGNRYMRRLLLMTATFLLTIFAWGGVAHAGAPCEFKLGFKSLADQIPHVVGQPLEDEHWGANGDSLQRTTTGLMVWRKADNWTAFTNGSTTWINGPYGVQSRLNGERFLWERESQELAAPPVPAQSVPAAPAQPVAPVDANFHPAVEYAALEMINESRRQHGVQPLSMDESLRGATRAHSRDMAQRGFFAHVDPDGRGLAERLRAAGIAFGYAAENLGWSAGYSPLDGVAANHTQMVAEIAPNDGHRRNILNDRLRKVGIGVYTGADGRVYYTCKFVD
jgi:uncharacterized protein YkwD